jgi:UDPglucose 6-dehydrogenase
MITVIGLGFVGLTTALGFSYKGFKVFGYDADRARSTHLKAGRVPFFETDLEKILKEQLERNFFVKENLQEAIEESSVIFFCVGTPCLPEGRADLSFFKKAVGDCLRCIPKGDYKTLVIKSTVPPGTTLTDIKPFIEQQGFTVGHDLGLANNPEFLREGVAFEDFIHSDRIVIGACDEKSASRLKEIYRLFGAPVFCVSPTTGEFIKYLSNTLLATMISFSNEMSMLADALGDVHLHEAFRILHLDRRWSGNPANMVTYVYPGCGFGGSCLPKDTQALLHQAQAKGYTSHLLEEVLKVNARIKDFVFQKISASVPTNERIGIFGLAFKPNSDDVRYTPSRDIIQTLLNQGYTNIVAYDPMASDNFRKEYKLPIEYATSLDEALARSSIAVILTAWKEFVEQQNKFKNKKVLDFRYAFKP